MRVEVLGGPERRRRWRFEDKARLVAQKFEPGVSVCAGGAPERHRTRSSLHVATAGPGGAARRIRACAAVRSRYNPASEPAPAHPPRRRRTGLIEVELGRGRRLWVDRDVDAAALRRVLDALGER